MAVNSPSTQWFQWSDATAGVKFSVNFPKAPEMELVLIGAELYQDIEQHDRVVLHFKGKPFVKGTELHHRDPVVFTYKNKKVTKTFNGFIHVVDPQNTLKTNNTDVVCVGMSSLMNNPDQKVHTNVTSDQVVAKIAKKHNMKAITQRHPRKRKAIVQTGDTTDWQLLRRLAKQTGFALSADNGTIIFVSKNKIYEDNKKNAPYFNYVDDPIGGIATKSDRNTGTILKFNAQLADENPELRINVNHIITGVQENTGKVIKTKHPKKAPANTRGRVIPGELYL